MVKLRIFLLLSTLCVTCSTYAAAVSSINSDHTALLSDREVNSMVSEDEWNDFKIKYKKKYDSSSDESYRKMVYAKNKIKIAKLNEENLAQVHQKAFGVTEFTDLEVYEFTSLYLTPNLIKYIPNDQGILPPTSILLDPQTPTNFSWVNMGATTPIKNQGACGSCWAFSATEMVESMVFLTQHTLPTLSVQQLVSCDRIDSGCRGGWPSNAFNYIQTYGQESDSAYPYTSGNGSVGVCNYNADQVTTHINGWKYIIPICNTYQCSTQNSYEAQLQTYIANSGPASIAVNASSWQFYRGGIMAKTNCNGSLYYLNHAVQLVGYGLAGSTQYWLARNQWGANWGENGYIRLEFGGNTCGVADVVTTPILS